jgi:hypothetical protein
VGYGDNFPHTASVIDFRETGARVQGEKEVKPFPGTPFACFLILPQGGAEQQLPRGRRTVTRPTLLVALEDDAGAPVVISSAAKIDVTAPELAQFLDGLETVRWEVDGDPTPFARPGDPVGSMVNLKRVRD